MSHSPWADPGLFSRGVQACRPENILDNILFFLASTYLTVYRGGPMILLQRKLYFSKDPEGVQHFPGGGGGGGGPAFSGGGGVGRVPNANFNRNPFNLWFFREGPDPYPPHMFTDHRPTQDTVTEESQNTWKAEPAIYLFRWKELQETHHKDHTR